MPFHVRDEETDSLVRELARRKRVGLTEAVKVAVRNELKAEAAQVPLRDRLRKIAEAIAAYPDTGAKADKKFFDDLSGH
jgi:antitoxin VapB